MQRLLGNYGNRDSNIRPTFGVSFGLPQGGGGYPINPFGANPYPNPYGNVLGGGGINLGLVSVNPLVSVQLTKDEDGEKVIKPFVNLHVTPNDFLVQKVGSFLYNKKQALHHHVHEHNYPRPPYYHNHHEPIYHHNPNYQYSPAYIPHSPHHGYDHGHIYADHKPQHYYEPEPVGPSYYNDNYNHYSSGGFSGGGDYGFFGRALNDSLPENNIVDQYRRRFHNQNTYPSANTAAFRSGKRISFPTNRRRRDTSNMVNNGSVEKVSNLILNCYFSKARYYLLKSETIAETKNV